MLVLETGGKALLTHFDSGDTIYSTTNSMACGTW